MADNEELWRRFLGLLAQDSVSELEANGPASFFIKKEGKRVQVSMDALSEKDYVEGFKKYVVPLVRGNSLWAEKGYLFEGPLTMTLGGKSLRGRCHVVLPPATEVPQLTIAKKSTSLVTLEALAGTGTLSADMYNFVRAAIEARLCCVISGPTGAGKTTFLEACTKLIPQDVRIGVAEDSPELSLVQPNVTYLHSVPWQPGLNPNDVASLSWIVQQFNRMRVDMIVVGETRGPEFASFLQAANSGIEGSLTTIHANDPKMCITRMTGLAMRGSEGVPLRAINQDIANAIDLIVQLTITPQGKHRISAIEEVTKTVSNDEKAGITTNRLYEWVPAQDAYRRVTPFTDALRKRLTDAGLQAENLQRLPVGQLQRPGLSQSAPSSGSHGGLPVGGRS